LENGGHLGFPICNEKKKLGRHIDGRKFPLYFEDSQFVVPEFLDFFHGKFDIFSNVIP
jgi:hypothetical protein